MKKVIFLVLLGISFASCSTDDNFSNRSSSYQNDDLSNLTQADSTGGQGGTTPIRP